MPRRSLRLGAAPFFVLHDVVQVVTMPNQVRYCPRCRRASVDEKGDKKCDRCGSETALVFREPSASLEERNLKALVERYA